MFFSKKHGIAQFVLTSPLYTGVIPKYEARHSKGILCNKSGVRSNKTL